MDIAQRLAQWAENDMRAEAVALEAKYEIERLREALKKILTHETDYDPSDCIEIARAALKGDEL